MNLKELNHAGEHAVFGSIEVLGDISGSGVQEIKRSVDLIQQKAETALKQTNRYWEELSSDSVITPIEKQQLYKEMKSITNSQAAIMYQAAQMGLAESAVVTEFYYPRYSALYNYLYSSIKLFDDMENPSIIDDRDTFNQYFYKYYYAESFVQLGLSMGIVDALSIHVLSSLQDEGEEGDVGIYKGGMYQYVNGEWKNVNSGNYKGALAQLPNPEQDCFFLASDNFTVVDTLYVNGEELYVNGETLGIPCYFEKGYIYYCQNDLWFKESDKSNYRYVAAFADVLNVTGELPQIFQDGLDALQDQIDELSGDLSDLADSIIDHIPVYLGAANVLPSDALEGDYFVWSGATTGETFVYSEILQKQNGQWVHLDPEEWQNHSYYMEALADILSLNNTTSGYFSSLFAQAFYTSSAVMDNLDVKTIYLRTNGNIQSANTVYSAGETGLLIDAAGNIDANGNVHLGGRSGHKVGIGVSMSDSLFQDYDVVIGGNTFITGKASIDGDVVARTLKTPNYSDSQKTGVRITSENYGVGGYPLTAQIILTRQIKSWGEPVTIDSFKAAVMGCQGNLCTTVNNLYSRLAQYNMLNSWVVCTGMINGATSVSRIFYDTWDNKLHFFSIYGGQSYMEIGRISSLSILL